METYTTRICRLIERSLQRGFASAYLFIGGDADMRRELIRRCVGSFPDAEQIRIDPDTEQQTSISVTRVREVRSRLSCTAFNGATRIVLCEQAELLTVQAGNALLKHIEEPPSDTIWLFGCLSKESVLLTIASRCQCISLPSLRASVLTPESAKRYTSWRASLSAPVWVRMISVRQEPSASGDLNEQEQFIWRALHECTEHTQALSLLIGIAERVRELRASHALALSQWAQDRLVLSGLESEYP